MGGPRVRLIRRARGRRDLQSLPRCDQIEGAWGLPGREENLFRLYHSQPTRWKIPPGPWGIFPGLPEDTPLHVFGLVVWHRSAHTMQDSPDARRIMGEEVQAHLGVIREHGRDPHRPISLVLWAPDGSWKVWLFRSRAEALLGLQGAVLGPIAHWEQFSLLNRHNDQSEVGETANVARWATYFPGLPGHGANESSRDRFNPAWWVIMRRVAQTGEPWTSPDGSWTLGRITTEPHLQNLAEYPGTSDMVQSDAALDWFHAKWGGSCP